MCAFVVLGLVFFPYQEIGLGKRLQNDVFCVKWDVKPQLSQSRRKPNCSYAMATCHSCLSFITELSLQPLPGIKFFCEKDFILNVRTSKTPHMVKLLVIFCFFQIKHVFLVHE